MRPKLLLPILAAALLGMTACDIEDLGNYERYHKDFHYGFPLNTGGRLSVETFNGAVEVSGWDQETVDISGTSYAPSQSEADNLKVEVDHSPDSVSVRVARPSFRHGNWGARFVIKVPRKAVLDRITTSNAAIRTVDGVGPSRFRSSNGQIHVQGLHGNLEAQTSNSSIELLDVDGEMRAHSSNGHIRVEGLTGSLDSSTSNSSITVHVPSSVNARLMARTSNGSVSSDFELRLQGEFSRRQMEGVIGSGGPLIDLSTSNGNIRLLKM